jgi:hypothetical protein
MSEKLNNIKINKYIPKNILSSLSHIDYETFPFDCNKISDPEILFILRYFISTGKSFSEIKAGLVEIADGKENEMSEFVTNYSKRVEHLVLETILVYFLGVLLGLGLYQGIMSAV